MSSFPVLAALSVVAVLGATVLSFERPFGAETPARPALEVVARLFIRAGLWGLALLGFAALAGDWPGGAEVTRASKARSATAITAGTK